jgi:hypothetical protein
LLSELQEQTPSEQAEPAGQSVSELQTASQKLLAPHTHDPLMSVNWKQLELLAQLTKPTSQLPGDVQLQAQQPTGPPGVAGQLHTVLSELMHCSQLLTQVPKAFPFPGATEQVLRQNCWHWAFADELADGAPNALLLSPSEASSAPANPLAMRRSASRRDTPLAIAFASVSNPVSSNWLASD